MKMKDKSIIKNLYREGIPGAEKVIINDEDYKVHREKKNRLEEALRKTFSKEQEELFCKCQHKNVKKFRNENVVF